MAARKKNFVAAKKVEAPTHRVTLDDRIEVLAVASSILGRRTDQTPQVLERAEQILVWLKQGDYPSRLKSLHAARDSMTAQGRRGTDTLLSTADSFYGFLSGGPDSQRT